MSERRRDQPVRPATVAFFVILGSLLFLPARFSSFLQMGFSSIVWPAQAVSMKAARGASVMASGFFGAFRRSDESARLRRTIELQRATIAKQQNTVRRLTELLRQVTALKNTVPDHEVESMVPAGIVGLEISATQETIILNAGTRKGVVEGSGVLCGEIAIGSVVQVGVWASRSRLLTEPGRRTGAVVARTGNEGILEGAGSGKFLFLYVPREADIQVGDALVAPSDSESFPAGVLLGLVTEVQRDPSDPSYHIVAAPPIQYSSLEDVVVVRRAAARPEGQ